MSIAYRPDLLAPYLALPQGEKIQAECMFRPALSAHSEIDIAPLAHRRLDRR